MLKPVTLTLAIVLAARNEVKLLLPSCQASGPAPLQASHCPLLFDVDALLVLADTLAKANAAAPPLSPAMIMSSTTVRVATPLLTVGLVSVCDIFLTLSTMRAEHGSSPRNLLKFSSYVVD